LRSRSTCTRGAAGRRSTTQGSPTSCAARAAAGASSKRPCDGAETSARFDKGTLQRRLTPFLPLLGKFGPRIDQHEASVRISGTCAPRRSRGSRFVPFRGTSAAGTRRRQPAAHARSHPAPPLAPRMVQVAASCALHGVSLDDPSTTQGAAMLRIGLVSDTHGLLRPEAEAFLAGSDFIVHAGDVGGAHILEALAALAPLTVVRGNNDH